MRMVASAGAAARETHWYPRTSASGVAVPSLSKNWPRVANRQENGLKIFFLHLFVDAYEKQKENLYIEYLPPVQP